MHASDELRYDHEVVRAKLSSLEMYLPSSRECTCTLSRLTDSLASCLRSHTEREEALLAMRALPHGSYGSFLRSFTLPAGVDAAKVNAAYKNGVLEVTLPKLAEAKAKQIKVEVK